MSKRLNYKSGDDAITVADLIDKHYHHELKDGKLGLVGTSIEMAHTTQFFIQSSNNWFPSVISLDKTFRQQ